MVNAAAEEVDGAAEGLFVHMSRKICLSEERWSPDAALC